MVAAAIPRNEAARLQALAETGILDTPPEPAFDDIAQLASELCGVPVALVSLVDKDRQWFKARVNVAATETSREISFCAHAILGRDPLVVPDVLADPRFADNPAVLADPGVRFYAGVPLLLDDDIAVGTLCVVDYRPHQLAPRQLEALRALGRQVSRELRLRRELNRSAPPPAPEPPTLLEGDVVAERWRVEKSLGKGGVGEVFSARGADGDRVAIKLLHAAWIENDEVVERFVREARVLAQLRSPHVVHLLDVGNLGPHKQSLPFIVLEFLEGTSLDQVLAARGPIPWAEAVAWVADACDGVAEAHDLGIVHRDLKPSNLFLVDADDGTPVVKVLDFGIAKADPPDDAPLTRVNVAIGSPAYMPPEQVMSASEVDARSDVWSMGASLYELLTQRLPFPGRSYVALCSGVLTKAPAPIRDDEGIPEALQLVLLRCLQKAPENRYATMRELGRELRAIAG